MKDKKRNPIVDKTLDFACEIIDLHKLLVELKLFRIADQLCGCGTSIGANVWEAQRAVSKADFINKMGIALKEAEETEFWFTVIERKIFNIEEKLRNDLLSIIKMLIAIINSAKRNTN